MLIPQLILALAPAILQQPGGGEFLPTWTEKLATDDGHLTAVQDIDGDGIDDWLRSNHRSSPYFTDQGSIQARSGSTGELLWNYLGSSEYQRVGYLEPLVEDLDGDGNREVILYGFPLYGDGLLVVLNIQTGQEIWRQACPADQYYFARQMHIADLNGDGQKELLTSSWDSTGNYDHDFVHCFGADGTPIWQYETPLGWEKIDALDLDGDGILEVIVSTPLQDNGQIKEAGAILILDSSSGTLRWKNLGEHRFQRLGGDFQFCELDQVSGLDLLAQGPIANASGVKNVGSVIAYSGIDGSELWKKLGSIEGEQIGSSVDVADINGNGSNEVIIGSPMQSGNDGLVQAVNGIDGSVIWQTTGLAGSGLGLGSRLFTGDFQGIGSQQILVERSHKSVTNSDINYFGWEFLDGVTGLPLWEIAFPVSSEEDPQYIMDDLNHDGVTEFIFSGPEMFRPPTGNQDRQLGLVYVFDAQGNYLWHEQGVDGGQQYGDEIQLGDLNGDGQTDILIHSVGSNGYPNSFAGMLEERNGISGDLIRRSEGEHYQDHYGDNAQLHDINHDGVQDIISSSKLAIGWRGNSQGELVVLNGTSGEIIWQMEGNKERARFPREIRISPDQDGDGWDEIVVLGNSSLFQVPGDGNFHGFLEASDDEISISNGGRIDLNLDFTSLSTWNEYLIVASAHGPGLNYELNLPMPITIDHWFYMSLDHKLPTGIFSSFYGVLDSSGQAVAEVTFKPGQIPVSALGQRITFAALSRIPWKNWKYCSVPKSVTATL